MTIATEPTPLLTCPSWCVGDHHDADVDMVGQTVYHPGPRIGEMSFAGTTMLDGTVVELAASCQDFGTGAGRQTASELRQLATDALAAAEWLEAHS